MAERIDAVSRDTFLSGPTEFLASIVAGQIALVPQFVAVFGPRIDAYQRLDYSMRELPAIRIYNNTFTKDFESWFIEGELILDAIFPPATRREKLQLFQDTVSAALLQQFRRTAFFEAVTALVPGLNELGKSFSVDKALGFSFGSGDPAPLTQMRANFRLDLRQWDDFLTQDGRTKADPFERTIENLEVIHTEIEGLLEDGTIVATVESLQNQEV